MIRIVILLVILVLALAGCGYVTIHPQEAKVVDTTKDITLGSSSILQISDSEVTILEAAGCVPFLISKDDQPFVQGLVSTDASIAAVCTSQRYYYFAGPITTSVGSFTTNTIVNVRLTGDHNLRAETMSTNSADTADKNFLCFIIFVVWALLSAIVASVQS